MFGTIVVRQRTGIWLLTVGLLALMLVFPATAFGQVSTPEAGEDAVYRDPAGRFSVPIPTNWVAEEHDGYVSIVTSDGKISLSIVVISGTSASAAIGEALELLDPAGTPVAPLVATPLSEGDEVAIITADDGSESGQLVQAIAQRVGDVVFVLVLQGDLEAVGLRQVQVDKIFYGVQVDMSAVGSPMASPVS